jgi:autotransporter passenger strand-loop-strand repeat protein
VDGLVGVLGSSLGATIGSGGGLTVAGAASGTTIDSGGYEYVASGGTESGATISGGGVLELASGGSVGNGAVTFADSAGGFLTLDDAKQFVGFVAGFGGSDDIALLDIPYTSGTTTFSWSQTTTDAGASGTLTVHDDTDSANIILLGSYLAGQFALAAYDGGTLVTDPPVGGSSAMLAPGPA